MTYIALSYTENHPDKERTFLGIFSSKEKATAAMQKHKASEEYRLPHAHISKYDYTFDEATLDQGSDEIELLVNEIKNSYPNGECPDCGEDIPNTVVEGGECSNCGHVFWSSL